MLWRRSATPVAIALVLGVAGCGSTMAGPAKSYPLTAQSQRATAPGLPHWIGRVAVVDLNVPGVISTPAQQVALDRVEQQSGQYRVAFLSLLEDINSVRVVRGTAQGHVVSYPSDAVLAQAKGARLLADVGLPTALVVDREGRIATRIIGVVDPRRLLATIRAVEANG
jgi:uncharacterized protein YceK